MIATLRRVSRVALAMLAVATVAHAHGLSEAPTGPRSFDELMRSWPFEPGVLIPLALTIALYARGALRLVPRRGLRPREVGCFAGGCVALAIALLSPLHPWGRSLFSVHMIQHELLMLIAAPLLVLGRPIAAILSALPSSLARGAALWTRRSPWRAIGASITNPIAAWTIHAVTLWLWHAPALFDAAVENETVHAAQHLSFLASALLFWWAVLQARERAMAYGAAVLFLFTTAVHSGFLGALISLSTTPWYRAYFGTTRSWGLAPLEDQQLGGLIMWVPACLVYMIAGLALFAAWLRAAGARARRTEAEWDAAALAAPMSTLEVDAP